MSKQRIVVLGHEQDPHIALVKQHLNEEPLIINVGNEVGGLSYRIDTTTERVVVTYMDQEIDLRPQYIRSIWNRRTHVRWLRPPLKVSPTEHKEYALSSLQRLADPIHTLLPQDAFWVSGHAAVQMAQHKPYQLQKARQCGFNVPDTIFTSDRLQAERFLEKHPVCIIKTLAAIMPFATNQYAAVRYSKELDLRGLEATPQIFQQAIEPDFEVRVAVIGEQTFASVVQDTSSIKDAGQGIRDFRTAFMKNTFQASAFALPADIAKACVEYVNRMGLVCGFFDLIFDKQGVCWFIECNPNGQWGFVDEKTVSKISQALAQLLETGKSPFAS